MTCVHGVRAANNGLPIPLSARLCNTVRDVLSDSLFSASPRTPFRLSPVLGVGQTQCCFVWERGECDRASGAPGRLDSDSPVGCNTLPCRFHQPSRARPEITLAFAFASDLCRSIRGVREPPYPSVPSSSTECGRLYGLVRRCGAGAPPTNAHNGPGRQPAGNLYSNSGVRPAARSCTAVATRLPPAGVWESAAPYGTSPTCLYTVPSMVLGAAARLCAPLISWKSAAAGFPCIASCYKL